MPSRPPKVEFWDRDKRLEVWESLDELSYDFNLPWMVIEDFNVITFEEEKLGGLLVNNSEVADFVHCIQTCNLNDLGFIGSDIPGRMGGLKRNAFLKDWTRDWKM